MKNPTRVLVFSLTLLFTACCHNRSASENPSPPAPAQGTTPAQGTPDAGTGTSQAGLGGKEAVEACVDRWLTAKKLDRYGHPEGTVYAGGTPLFNEATGESRDRMEYVFERQPEARQACASAGASGK
jgi:hypothetical protein